MRSAASVLLSPNSAGHHHLCPVQHNQYTASLRCRHSLRAGPSPAASSRSIGKQHRSRLSLRAATAVSPAASSSSSSSTDKHHRCRLSVAAAAASPAASSSTDKEEQQQQQTEGPPQAKKRKQASSWTSKETGSKVDQDYLHQLGTAQDYNINVDHGSGHCSDSARLLSSMLTRAHTHLCCLQARTASTWTASSPVPFWATSRTSQTAPSGPQLLLYAHEECCVLR